MSSINTRGRQVVRLEVVRLGEEVNDGHFLVGATRGTITAMTTARLLRFLFASLISIGLAVAPLLAPAAASGMASGQGSSDISIMQMADMSADMPCCPEEQKQSGCQDCPLLAICMLKVLQAGPAVVTATLDPRALALLRPLDDTIADGLTRPPPDHPPRSIV